jgi:uncharacterized protein YjbJ (UPF0337 family)
MDKDRIAGSVRQAGGAAWQMIGKLLGDHKIAAEGRSEMSRGKVQNAVGGLKDIARKIVGRE